AFTTLSIRNNSTAAVVVTGFGIDGTGKHDYVVTGNCTSGGLFTTLATTGVTIPPDATCVLGLLFFPGAAGLRTAGIFPIDSVPGLPVVHLTGTAGQGYYQTTANGVVTGFGATATFGDLSGQQLNAPIVAMAIAPFGTGYWLLGGDGGIFSFGDAQFYGSTGGIHLVRPVVALEPTPTGRGYWLVASDGGIFAFGDAGFYGSTGGMTLNKPVVGMASTPTGKGY